MKKITRLLSLLLVMALLACMLGACAKEPSNDGGGAVDTPPSGGETEQPPEEEEIKAAMIATLKGGTFWGPIEEGWMAACADYGWEGTYLTPTTDSRSELLELVETCMTQGYKVLAFPISDPTLWTDTLTRAREQGVTVIGVTSDAPGLLDAYVGADYTLTGVMYAEKFAELANADGVEELNLVTFQVDLAHTAQTMTRDGFIECMQEKFNGTLNVIAMDASETNAALTQDKLNAYYLAHPELNMAFCVDGAAMLGTGLFVQEMGLENQFYCMGADDTIDSLKMLRDGVYTIIHMLDLYGLGYSCAEVAMQERAGIEHEYCIPIPSFWIEKEGLDTYCAEKGIALD